MIPELHRSKLDRHARTLLREALSAGPWLWPSEAAALARAQEVVCSGPPPLVSGQCLLISVTASTASLWVLSAGNQESNPTPRRTVVAFGRRALHAWATAASVLPRSVPVLWTSLQPHASRPLEAYWLSSLVEQDALQVRESILEGSSFGLPFLLALASLVFDRPLPDDLAATGELEATGIVCPVAAVDRKTSVLVEHAPRIGRMLVPESQVAQAQQAAEDRLQVLGVRTAAEALGHAFGDDLAALLWEAGKEPQRRSELVQSFFELAVAGRGAMVDWTPVAKASQLALTHWQDLTRPEKQALVFAQAVAARHEGAQVGVQLPDRDWLESLPAPLRLDVLANLVQQAADTAEPDPEPTQALAETHIVRGADAFVQHLRLLGALGRLLAFTGRTRDALTLQQESARGFLERLTPADVSYPLAEWYRLAGVEEDQEAFDAAEQLRLRWTPWESLDRVGSPYVALARARALIRLGAAQNAFSALQELEAEETLPAHVRWSAARYLVGLLELQGNSDRAKRIAESLQTIAASPHRSARLAARYWDLMALDQALREQNVAQATEAVERLRSREQGLLRNLLTRAPQEIGREAWVARTYPY